MNSASGNRLEKQRRHEFDSSLRPSKEDKRIEGELMDQFTKTLQRDMGIKVDSVYKSGSGQKGTAVRGKSDMDVIAYIPTKETAGEFVGTKQNILQQTEKQIKEGAFSRADVRLADERTDFHLPLKVDYQGHEKSVDFLVARKPPLDRSLPALHAMYDDMKKESPEVWDHRSVELEPVRADLIRPLPPKVKDVIRELKNWKEEEKVPMKSYFVETLALHEHQKMGNPQDFDRDAFRDKIVDDLVHINSQQVTWPDRYNYEDYRKWPAGPKVLDPSNPYNNLVPGKNDKKEIMKKARNFQAGGKE